MDRLNTVSYTHLPAMEQAFRDAVRLENDLAAMCVPGANPGDIFLEGNRRLAAAGYVEEGHFYAHGQGYDIVDRPIFCPEETIDVYKRQVA